MAMANCASPNTQSKSGGVSKLQGPTTHWDTGNKHWQRCCLGVVEGLRNRLRNADRPWVAERMTELLFSALPPRSNLSSMCDLVPGESPHLLRPTQGVNNYWLSLLAWCWVSRGPARHPLWRPRAPPGVGAPTLATSRPSPARASKRNPRALPKVAQQLLPHMPQHPWATRSSAFGPRAQSMKLGGFRGMAPGDSGQESSPKAHHRSSPITSPEGTNCRNHHRRVSQTPLQGSGQVLF